MNNSEGQWNTEQAEKSERTGFSLKEELNLIRLFLFIPLFPFSIFR